MTAWDWIEFAVKSAVLVAMTSGPIWVLLILDRKNCEEFRRFMLRKQ